MSDAANSNRILLVSAGSVVVLLGIALMATRTGRTATASTPPVVVTAHSLGAADRGRDVYAAHVDVIAGPPPLSA